MVCARTIIANFVTRAFRRPATHAEVDPFLNMVTLARKQGDSFEEGIANALEAVLVSPPFLFRMEKDRPATPGHASVPVSDYSRTAWCLIEEVVMLRELFVRRKPLPGANGSSSLCLFFSGHERAERKAEVPAVYAASPIVSLS